MGTSVDTDLEAEVVTGEVVAAPSDMVPWRLHGVTDLDSPEVQELMAGYRRQLRRRIKSSNTLRAYASDWSHFVTWCDEFGLPPTPVHEFTLVSYLNYFGLHPDAAKVLSVSTLKRRVAAIQFYHADAGMPYLDYRAAIEDPIKDTLEAISREQARNQVKAAPISQRLLVQMVNSLPWDMLGQRDRALLTLGFLGALRRSELTGVQVKDLRFTDEGLRLNIPKSKTDQNSEGQTIYIPMTRHASTCATRQVQRWMADADITEGYVFRPVDRTNAVGTEPLTDQSVNLIVKRTLKSIGVNPAEYSGHSLRAGFATEAVKNGAPLRVMMKQTRHVRFETAEGYVREAEGFTVNGVNFLQDL